MLISLLSTMVLLLALMMAWIQVQRLARRVAEQHPEAGPLRLIGGGCGGHGHGHDSGHDSGQDHGRDLLREPGDAGSSPSRSGSSAVTASTTVEGCAACANTACKPGAPTACASTPQFPLLAD